MKNSIKIFSLFLALALSMNFAFSQKKITELPELVTPNPSDVIPIVNGAQTKKISISNLSEYISITGGASSCELDSFYVTDTMSALGGFVAQSTFYGCLTVKEIGDYTIIYSSTDLSVYSNLFSVFDGNPNVFINIDIPNRRWIYHSDFDYAFANDLPIISGINTLVSDTGTIIDLIASEINLGGVNASTEININELLKFSGDSVGFFNLQQDNSQQYVLAVDNSYGGKIKTVDVSTIVASDGNGIYDNDGVISEDRIVYGDTLSTLTFSNQKSVIFNPNNSFTINSKHYYNSSRNTYLSGDVIELGSSWSNNLEYVQVISPFRNPNWTTANRPTAAPAREVGTQGFNTTLSQMEYWNGTTWIQY